MIAFCEFAAIQIYYGDLRVVMSTSYWDPFPTRSLHVEDVPANGEMPNGKAQIALVLGSSSEAKSFFFYGARC